MLYTVIRNVALVRIITRCIRIVASLVIGDVIEKFDGFLFVKDEFVKVLENNLLERANLLR
jgi:hypothetical protein